MDTVLPSLLIGVVAGLRAMTAPAAISWAARLGWLDLAASPLAFLGYAFTPWIMTVLAVGELEVDKASDDAEPQAAGAVRRAILSGSLCGAAIGAAMARSSSGRSLESSGPWSGRSADMRSARAWPRRSAGICLRP